MTRSEVKKEKEKLGLQINNRLRRKYLSHEESSEEASECCVGEDLKKKQPRATPINKREAANKKSARELADADPNSPLGKKKAKAAASPRRKHHLKESNTASSASEEDQVRPLVETSASKTAEKKTTGKPSGEKEKKGRKARAPEKTNQKSTSESERVSTRSADHKSNSNVKEKEKKSK